jgi:hypothetical protein
VQITINTLGEGTYYIRDIHQGSVLEMVEAFGDAEVSVLAFTMDEAQVYLNKTNIISIEVE